MTKAPKRWALLRALTPEQKAKFGADCDAFIAARLKPRVLSCSVPGSAYHLVDITGRLRGHRYSFTRHYRAGDPLAEVEGFEQPYARIDHVPEKVDGLRFDVMWLRHTGKWWRLHAAIPFEKALDMVETEPVFQAA